MFFSGRFCSQRCVGAYASKRRAQMIHQLLESGERPTTKSATPSNKKPHGNSKRKKSEVLKVFIYKHLIVAVSKAVLTIFDWFTGV
jgi:hypothetical protein